MQPENFFVRFLVFGLIGWWPAWRGLVAEQRRLADRGNISQQQYARIVGRMAHDESLYSEVNVYFRMQALAWGITVALAASRVYVQGGSIEELFGFAWRWLKILLFVHA